VVEERGERREERGKVMMMIKTVVISLSIECGLYCRSTKELLTFTQGTRAAFNQGKRGSTLKLIRGS